MLNYLKMRLLRALARAPHDARMELHKLVTDAKNTLGIQ